MHSPEFARAAARIPYGVPTTSEIAIMRVLARVVVFLFSALHWLLMTIVGAHVNVIRNLFMRHPDAARLRQVKRD